METAQLEIESCFERMGARAALALMPNAEVRRRGGRHPAVQVDLRRDERGPYFWIERRWGVSLRVAETDARGRHLLLVADHAGHGPDPASRFLCGHDEREWFVAAVPESAPAESVQEAKDALKPQEVWDAMRAFDVSPDQRDKRWTAGFVRQGEWFFIPQPAMEVDDALVLRREPISRGRGKPHWCEFLHRQDGEEVMVSVDHPNGLTMAEFHKLSLELRTRRHYWQPRVRDARVFVRGRISHPDHATIYLWCWHRVVMNTESRARAMERVAFLD